MANLKIFNIYCSELYNVENIDELRRIAFESGISLNDIEEMSKEKLCKSIAASLVFVPEIIIPNNADPKEALEWICSATNDDYFVEEVRKWAVKAGYKKASKMKKKQICDMIIPDRNLVVPSYSESEKEIKDVYKKKYVFPYEKEKLLKNLKIKEDVHGIIYESCNNDDNFFKNYKRQVKKIQSIDELNEIDKKIQKEIDELARLCNKKQSYLLNIDLSTGMTKPEKENEVKNLQDEYSRKIKNAKTLDELDTIYKKYKELVLPLSWMPSIF